MAFLLAASMTLTMAPGAVMAEEMPGGSADVGIVSDTENADSTDTVEETAGQCTVTEGCTLEEGHAGECILEADEDKEQLADEKIIEENLLDTGSDQLEVTPVVESIQTLEIYEADQVYALASILENGEIVDGNLNESQAQWMKTLGVTEISSADEYNIYFKQVQEADISFTENISLNSEFVGIGSRENPFKGSVNGNGHTITLSTNVSTSVESVALFAWVSTEDEELTYESLHMAGSIEVNGECTYAASLIGYASGSNILHVKDCINEAKITNFSAVEGWALFAHASGMTGYTENLDMMNCQNNADINSTTNFAVKDVNKQYSSASSGLAAIVKDGTVKNCVNYGIVTADTNNFRAAAGVIFATSNGTITGCENYGEIQIKNSVQPRAQGLKVYAGGIIAYSDKELKTLKISDCKNHSNITVVTDSAVSNDVNWNHHCIGGIGGDVPSIYENCINYGNIDADIQVGGCHNIGGIEGSRQARDTFTSCENYGDINFKHHTTKTASYCSVGGIAALYGVFGATDCINENNVSVTLGETISAPCYIGGIAGKCDDADASKVINFQGNTNITTVKEGNNPNGEFRIGGVVGESARMRVENANVQTKVDAQGGFAKVGGARGYANTTYPFTVKDSVINMKAVTDDSTNTYIGAIAGKGFINSNDSVYIFNSEGFAKTARVRVEGPRPVGAEIENTIIYSNTDFNVTDSLDDNVAVAMLNGGFFLPDTKFEPGKLASPLIDNNVFLGWYKDAAFTGDPVTVPRDGETYYAKKEQTVYEENADINERFVYGQTSPVFFDVSLITKSADVISVISSNENVFTAKIDDNNKARVIVIPNNELTVGEYKETLILRTGDEGTQVLGITLTIEKAKPTYTVPEGLTAVEGQLLADIKLPEGFTWQDADTTSVGNIGENEFLLTYTPKDTINYEIVKDIPVVITVNPQILDVNMAPVIEAGDMTIIVGEEFNPLENVTAKDAEDGEIILTLDNIIFNNVDISKAGIYKVSYKVTDSQGTSVTKTITVTVKEKDVENLGLSGDQNRTGKKDVPSTGDQNKMTYPVFLLFGSLGLGVLALVYAKRKRKNL